MVAHDRSGAPASKYPEAYLDGVFLGINGDGLGEYHTDDYVFLAEYADDGLNVPPPEYGMAHEFYLEDMTLAEYIQATTEEFGPWKYLSGLARQVLSNTGIDPKRTNKQAIPRHRSRNYTPEGD